MDIPIYLDYNATTPTDPEVIEAILPYLYTHYGNPSSAHQLGKTAKEAVDKARKQVSKLLNCQPDEIIFTSGGTESNNTIIRGIALSNRNLGNHIITSEIEHPSVTEVCKWLEDNGYHVSYLPVDSFGYVNPEELESLITPETILVTIMMANNEVGTIQPIKQLANIAHQNGSYFHTDAAQAVGKIEVDVNKLGIDALSLAGHKLYAPKGIGAYYLRSNIIIPNLMFGADQEMGHRPGTENVLEIVGLGAACEIAFRDRDKIAGHSMKLRNYLYQELLSRLGSDQLHLNGHPDFRLPNTLSLSFKNVIATDLIQSLSDKVALSSGSACHSGCIDVSPVLKAMGTPLNWAIGTIRFSIGRYTTRAEIDQAIQWILEAIFQE